MKGTLYAFSLAGLLLLLCPGVGLHAEETGRKEEKTVAEATLSREDQEVVRMMELLELMELLQDMELLEGEMETVLEDKKR